MVEYSRLKVCFILGLDDGVSSMNNVETMKNRPDSSVIAIVVYVVFVV